MFGLLITFIHLTRLAKFWFRQEIIMTIMQKFTILQAEVKLVTITNCTLFCVIDTILRQR